MDNIIKAIEVSAAVTGILVFLLATVVVAALPRLRSRWHDGKPARFTLPCNDATALYERLAALLRPYGFWPDGASGGSFRLVPSDFRRFSKASNVSVTFPDDHIAEIRGQACWLAKIAGDQPVWLITEQVLPFPVWLRRHFAMTFALIVGFSFVVFVAIFMRFL
jgi:hypothetical protein